MGIDPSDIRTFEENIAELFDARNHACSYYSSREYDEIQEKAHQYDRRIRRKLGKKLFRKIWDEFYGMDELHGQALAALEESAYRRGFTDALFLSGQIRRAEQGLPSIFLGNERAPQF